MVLCAMCATNNTQYLSMKLVVMKTIRASDEATPSRELSRPLNVSRPIPWYAMGSERQKDKRVKKKEEKEKITSLTPQCVII